jgi:hypothetical protein
MMKEDIIGWRMSYDYQPVLGDVGPLGAEWDGLEMWHTYDRWPAWRHRQDFRFVEDGHPFHGHTWRGESLEGLWVCTGCGAIATPIWREAP